jgi:TolB-like protein/Tfp pilus assembly protein PilF
MLTVVLGAGALLVWYANRSPDLSPAAPDIGSLAVLPLEDLSRDRTQAFFADGLTEALITRLAGVGGLKVISRTSVLRFRDAAPPVPEIASLLGVQAVIEGAVLREGDRVRVTVRLVNGADGRSLWAQTYERELGDVLALHSEIAHAITERVAVSLTDGERRRLAQERVVRPEAYDAYLWGRFAGRLATRADIEESAVHFQRAVDVDPSFAAAYAGLAHAYNNLATLLIGAAPPSEVRPRAVAAARRALELDPDLAEAHAELAFAYMRDWRWVEAEAEFQRAVELQPNDAEILAKYSDYLGARGRAEEGIEMARRALERDPLSPYVNHNMGVQLYAARRYADAVRHMEAVVDVDPALVDANIVVGLALLELREFDRAIEALRRAAELHDRSPAALGLLANAYARSGRTADARAVLDELETRARTEYVAPPAFVYAYTGLGEGDRAFFWLEQSYRERSNLLAFLKTFPILDPLRGDPRFDDLLRRVNLAPGRAM